MRIAVRASESQKKEWQTKGTADKIDITWISINESLKDIQADVYFDLLFDEDNLLQNEYPEGSLVFVNTVCCTTREIQRDNTVRLNAWNGFLATGLVEVAVTGEATKVKAETILDAMGWKYRWGPDEPGMITARVISMVINEAYYSLQEGVSTKEDIDTAMKLGTNYPYGPFEWSEKIGLGHIYRLLKKLNKTDKRYTVAALLEEESLKRS